VSNNMQQSVMPAIFVGHGSPMNVLLDNHYTQTLKAWGRELAALRPKAIVVISAHWRTDGTFVTEALHPRTIHDFNGFPDALSQLTYPVNGDPSLVTRIKQLIPTLKGDREAWGLDHGSWSILLHLFPAADIPVVQLSLDRSLTAQQHWQLGERLQTLRDERVLFIGSGNIVHSFRAFASESDAPPLPVALEFDEAIAAALQQEDRATLVHYQRLGEAARFAVPTSEHYEPMLYIAALRRPCEPLQFKVSEIQHASMSMRSFQVG
jgi:4,5-DOPA dioxygenase extradiol